MKIKAIVVIFTSDRHTAFRWVDPLTGHFVEAKISGGESNVTAAARHILGWNGPFPYFYTVKEMKWREFERETKEMPYAGCNPEELAEFIRAGLGKQQTEESAIIEIGHTAGQALASQAARIGVKLMALPENSDKRHKLMVAGIRLMDACRAMDGAIDAVRDTFLDGQPHPVRDGSARRTRRAGS